MATSINVFKHIWDFVNDLNSSFGTKQHSLELYNRFLETKVDNEEKKQMQIHIFKNFIESNDEAITKRDYTLFQKPDIVYNKKCVIKLVEIFKISDIDIQKIIWDHLLVIKTSINPTAEAIETLNDTFKSDGSNEGDFLSNLFQTISGSVSPENLNNANPMAGIMNMLQSGVFNNITNDMNSKISSGQLDIGKLLGTVTNMLPKELTNQMGGLPNMSGMKIDVVDEKKE